MIYALVLMLAMTGQIEHGVCYAVPGDISPIVSSYGDLGATFVKFNGAGSFWNDIQPNKDGPYVWDQLDLAVGACLAIGMRPIIVIGPGDGWGSRSLKWSELGKPDTSAPVRSEYLPQYKAYVRAMAERYGGDGVGAFEVLTEAQHTGYWVGTTDEYISLLRTTYTEIKVVNPNIKVILSGFWFGDLFDDGKISDTDINTKIASLTKVYNLFDYRYYLGQSTRMAIDFNRRVLQESQYYDIVEFHLLSSPESIPYVVAWIVQNMPELKPIWIGDCCVTPPIPCSNIKGWSAASWTSNIFAPPLYTDGDKRWKVLTGTSVRGYTYSDVKQWFLEEQVKHVSRILELSEMSGIEAIGWYSWLDWTVASNANAFQKHWAVCGLREYGTSGVGDTRPVYLTIGGNN